MQHWIYNTLNDFLFLTEIHYFWKKTIKEKNDNALQNKA